MAFGESVLEMMHLPVRPTRCSLPQAMRTSTTAYSEQLPQSRKIKKATRGTRGSFWVYAFCACVACHRPPLQSRSELTQQSFHLARAWQTGLGPSFVVFSAAAALAIFAASTSDFS